MLPGHRLLHKASQAHRHMKGKTHLPPTNKQQARSPYCSNYPSNCQDKRRGSIKASRRQLKPSRRACQQTRGANACVKALSCRSAAQSCQSKNATRAQTACITDSAASTRKEQWQLADGARRQPAQSIGKQHACIRPVPAAPCWQ